MFNGRKILVTGGAGFIGSHLVERLVGLGARVTTADWNPAAKLWNLKAVLDHIELQQLDLISGDVKSFLTEGGFDLVFHLAAGGHGLVSVQDPRQDFERNAVATFNLLDALRKTSPRTAVLFTSSAYVYSGGSIELIRETDPTVPGSPYGVSKLAAERYVEVFARIYGLRGAVLRLFSVYGPRLRKQIIYDIMCRLRENPDLLSLRGDGTQVRDLNYVSNVVDALLLVAERAPLEGEAYNLASGEHIDVKRVAEHVARAMGVNPRLVFDGKVHPSDTSHWFADTTRIQALGYYPVVRLNDGLTRTVEWFLQDQSVEQDALPAVSGAGR